MTNNDFMVEESLLRKDLTDQVIVVTGGSSGIGKSVSMQLFKQGATVIIGTRQFRNGEAVRRELLEQHNASEESLDARFHFFSLDLSDFSSIRSFAANVRENFPRLNCLVNNAGGMNTPYSKTKQGHELTMGVNHIGPFLLTNLLTDLLAQSGSGKQPSRIVNTASLAASYAPLQSGGRTHVPMPDLEDFKEPMLQSGGRTHVPMPDLEDFKGEKQKYDLWRAYGQSKLANVLHAMELDRRFKMEGKHIQAVSLHPGLVCTEIFRQSFLKFVPLWPIHGLAKLFFGAINVWNGSQTTLHCILADEVQSGAFYSVKSPETRYGYPKDVLPIIGWPCLKYPSPEMNEENARMLWLVSEECIADEKVKCWGG